MKKYSKLIAFIVTVSMVFVITAVDSFATVLMYTSFGDRCGFCSNM